MYGLEAISANNGWVMAAAGAAIVLLGLSALSFVISQLHRVIGLVEKKAGAETPAEKTGDTVRALGLPEKMPDDIHAVADIYRNLSETLTPPFQLQHLYRRCLENGLPHPHLSLRSLREAGLLVPDGDGRFSWHP